MRTLTVSREESGRGPLILVNREYPMREEIKPKELQSVGNSGFSANAAAGPWRSDIRPRIVRRSKSPKFRREGRIRYPEIIPEGLWLPSFKPELSQKSGQTGRDNRAGLKAPSYFPVFTFRFFFSFSISLGR